MSMVNTSDVGNEVSMNAISSEMPTVVPMSSYLGVSEAGDKQKTLHKEQPPFYASAAAGDANSMGHSSDVQDDKQERKECAHDNVRRAVHDATGE